MGDATGQAVRVTYRDVFRDREFRALWLAQLLSVAGDQLARVALTVLVYRQTQSALLAAVTFVTGLLPVFLGGVFLSGLADRLPRRAVMIGCDLARVVLVLAMTVPGVPLAGLVGLLFAVSTLSAPFTAARAAVYPEILKGEKYTAATAVTLTTIQLAQVAGFAVSGVLVSAFSVNTSLVADAATFGASALLIRLWVQPHGAGSRAPEPQDERRKSGAMAGMLDGVRLVFGNPALRTPMLFGWLAALYDAPEGIATPFAQVLGHGAVTVGLLLAVPALGNTLGCLAYGRLAGPQLRRQLMGPLAVAAPAVLILIALRPSLPVTLAILALSGGFACYQVTANAEFVASAPERQRSQAFGLAAAGMSLGQGVTQILAGAAVQYIAPVMVIAAAGALGATAATVLAVTRPASAPLGSRSTQG